MNYEPTPETLDIVKTLGGVWRGTYAMCRCPAHADSTASLSIKQGRTTTLVTCFSGCDRQDVLAAIRLLIGRGVRSTEAVVAPDRPKNDHHKRIWGEARHIAGTLAERYLTEVRGITFQPADCRYHPRCPQGRAPETQYLPALLVGVFRHRELIAIQRIFLDPATARYTSKLILGDSRGGSWPSTWAGDHMIIAEGFETACAHQQIEGQQTGTCFGTRNLPIFDPPAGIQRITYLPDNDRAGMTAAQQAIPIRTAQGIEARLKVCPSPYGDWADITRPPARP